LTFGEVAKMPEGPLKGIRVLEFSQIVAAPFCGCILSDLGADVVKVEALSGDPHRNAGAIVPGLGKRFQSLNRGKRSIAIDLSQEEGRRAIHRLVKDVDVVTINYRVGVAERLGIDYESLRAINPRIIYAEITGFGSSGPLKDRAGTDIVGQAYTGLMLGDAKTDEYGQATALSAFSAADYCAGFAASTAINAALLHRERTGEGQKIETSLLRAALAVQDTVVMREPIHDSILRDPMIEEIQAIRARGGEYGEILEARTGNARRRAAFRIYYAGYQTQDGGTLVLGALTPATRKKARSVLGITDDPSESPDFDAEVPENAAIVEELRNRVRATIRTKPLEEWVEEFTAAGVPCSPVNVPEEMSDDPQVTALGMMEEIVHPVTGPQRVIGPVATLSASPSRVHGPAPVLGADTKDVLMNWGGLTEAEIEALISHSLIRTDE